MASSGVMDMNRPTTPTTRTPKDNEMAMGETQTMKLVLDYLHGHGLERDLLAIATIQRMASEEITELEMRMMQLVSGLTQEVKTLNTTFRTSQGWYKACALWRKAGRRMTNPRRQRHIA